MSVEILVVRLLDCNSGEILGEESCFNKQIQWGTDILSRIFFCKDDRKKLEEIRLATVESIIECIPHARLPFAIASIHSGPGSWPAGSESPL